MNLVAPSTSFHSLSFFYGEGRINNFKFKNGDTFFLPAGKKAVMEGTGALVLTEVKGK